MSKLMTLGSVSKDTREANLGKEQDGLCTDLGQGAYLHYRIFDTVIQQSPFVGSIADCEEFT